MHAANDTNHKNEIVFLEVPEPECIIFQYPDPSAQVFADRGLCRGRRKDAVHLAPALRVYRTLQSSEAMNGEQGFTRIMPGLLKCGRNAATSQK